MASSSRSAGQPSLLTSAERNLLESTTGSALTRASQQQVQAMTKRARALRDKWRDLAEKQSRSTKRTKDRGAANARSREKHELFHGAVGRLEARLAEFNGRAAAAKGATQRAPGKAARTAKHRSARAAVRAELREATRTLAGKRAAAKPAAQRVKPAAAAAKVEPAPPAVRISAARKPAKGASKKTLTAQAAGQRVGFDAAKQRKARAAATVARLKFDGQVTRRGGHTLARGRRAQARRDGRTR